VRLFFLHAQFGEPVQNFVSFDFQLPRQLVDPNLLHRKSNFRQLWSGHLLAMLRASFGVLHAFRSCSFRLILSGFNPRDVCGARSRVFYGSKLFRAAIFRGGFHFLLRRLVLPGRVDRRHKPIVCPTSDLLSSY